MPKLDTNDSIMNTPYDFNDSIVKNKQLIIDNFHDQYYNSNVWNNGLTNFLGTPITKCPLDLWVYQEIIFKLKPTTLIETGMLCGGSALWFEYIMLLCKCIDPTVFTIDINPEVPDINHPHIKQIIANSTDDLVLELIEGHVERTSGNVMVILDSDHSKEHVLAELDAYSKLVTIGSYLVVEDTNVNGNPVFPEHGPGPKEALDEWLPNNPNFKVDKNCEKFGMTFAPGGFLLKVGV